MGIIPRTYLDRPGMSSGQRPRVAAVRRVHTDPHVRSRGRPRAARPPPLGQERPSLPRSGFAVPSQRHKGHSHSPRALGARHSIAVPAQHRQPRHYQAPPAPTEAQQRPRNPVPRFTKRGTQPIPHRPSAVLPHRHPLDGHRHDATSDPVQGEQTGCPARHRPTIRGCLTPTHPGARIREKPRSRHSSLAVPRQREQPGYAA